MKKDYRNNDEGQEIVQRIEAVQRRIADGKAAPQKRYDSRPDDRNCREQVGDDRGGPIAHLSPRQDISHKSRGDQQQQDDDPENPEQLARGLVRSVIKAAEQMDIDDSEKHRPAVHMDIANEPAIVHIAHYSLNRIKSEIGTRRV